MITALLPQRPPMLMVDELLKANESSATTCFRVLESNLFCKNGFLQSTALIENIAQTAAAQAGNRAKILLEKQQPEQAAAIGAKIGFIGAIKHFKMHRLPKVGELLRTEIEVTTEILNFSVIFGKIWVGDESVAEAELKIFLQETA